MDMEGDKLRALEAKHRLETERIEGYRSQVAKHTIRAERPGLVVYGPPELRPRYDRRIPIREGTRVRERQVILTIPDMSTAAVNVKIHESAVQRVAEGQPVRIRVNANPDVVIAGQVTSVAELPDAGSRFMNPSMNAYEAIIRIEETYDWLRPGMSAEVEILVDRIEDALYVPLQAVLLEEDGHACYVLENGRPARRVVTTGGFSNDLIAIRSGLEEGEEVLLRPSAALKQ